MKNVTFYKFDIESENNSRLDQLISSRLPEYSRSTIKNWINAEKILVNGKICSPKDKISSKSEIEIEVHPCEDIDILSEDIPLNILHEDEDLIVVNKNSNMVTHTAVGNYSGTLQNALLFKYPELRDVPRAGIIHRLDKQTSGLLIIARTLKAHNNLTNEAKYYDDYTGKMQIYQLGSLDGEGDRDVPTYGIEATEVFPQTLSAVEYNYGSSNQLVKINVGFAYKQWYNLTTDHVAGMTYGNSMQTIHEQRSPDTGLFGRLPIELQRAGREVFNSAKRQVPIGKLFKGKLFPPFT